MKKFHLQISVLTLLALIAVLVINLYCYSKTRTVSIRLLETQKLVGLLKAEKMCEQKDGTYDTDTLKSTEFFYDEDVFTGRQLCIVKGKIYRLRGNYLYPYWEVYHKSYETY